MPVKHPLQYPASHNDTKAISHRKRPLFGIQFHPESFGTIEGDRLIVNFIGGLQ